MTGLAQPIEIQGETGETASWRPGLSPDVPVIGVICAGDLAVHRNTVKEALQRGLERHPDAVWVCIEAKSDRMTHDLMIGLDIEPVVLPMNDAWRSRDDDHGYDFRRLWRDLEMLHLCDELIVFHKRSASSPWRDRVKSGLYTRKLVVVDIGKEPSKRLKERKK